MLANGRHVKWRLDTAHLSCRYLCRIRSGKYTAVYRVRLHPQFAVVVNISRKQLHQLPRYVRCYLLVWSEAVNVDDAVDGCSRRNACSTTTDSVETASKPKTLCDSGVVCDFVASC